MNLARELRLFLVAMQFYSRLPVPRSLLGWMGWDPGWLAPATRYFPLVGVLVASLTAVLYAACGLVLPHGVALAVAMAAGLIPVVCVGEPEDDRLLGRAEEVVAEQMAESLPDGVGAAGGVVAYEPVWAIGTGRTPTEADISAMHAMMRAKLTESFPGAGAGLRLLYGGSVKPGNAVAILALPHVDGALVGGASLVAEDFLAIARAAG